MEGAWTPPGGRSLEQPGLRQQKASAVTPFRRGLDISSRQLGMTVSFPVREDCAQACVLERSLGRLWGKMERKGQVKDKGKLPWKLFQVSK